MWDFLARFILRNRIPLLAVVALITAGWAYIAITRIEINHNFQTMMPEKDSVSLQYKDMKARFGEDGMVVVIGVQAPDMFTLKKFTAWQDLGNALKKIEGIDSVFSVAHMYAPVKNDSLKKFELKPVSPHAPATEVEMEAIKNRVLSYPFYEGLLYNKTGANLMMVFVNAEKFNSPHRGTTIQDLVKETEKYESEFEYFHYSGMPFIRDTLFHTLKDEITLFIILAALVSAIVIFIVFRSFRVIAACMTVIAVATTWSFGTIGLFRFEISQLTALVPPLMIVIAVPNCVYLITRYHQEYKHSHSRLRALTLVIRKVGAATFITNATTAAGLATFIFTHSDKLIEFGIVASINVFCLFFLAIILIPILFSYMGNPPVRHTKHLEKRWVHGVIDTLVHIASFKRRWVYIGSLIVIALGLWGISLIKTTGSITEDLSNSSKVKKDLRFIEQNFGGMVPFEVVVNFKQRGQLMRDKNLEKLEEIQLLLAEQGVFSKSLSLVDAVKFVNQAFYNGNPEKYKLIERRDLVYIKPYFDNLRNDSRSATKGFIDSTETRTRITTQIKDLGAKALDSIESYTLSRADLILNPDRHEVDSMLNGVLQAKGEEKDRLLQAFYDENPRVYTLLLKELAGTDSTALYALEENPELVLARQQEKEFDTHLKKAVDNSRYDILITGLSSVYAKGTSYLIKNLMSSIVFAVIAISVLMALLFRSLRMVAISMLPNIIPQIVTAAIMGFFDIPLKPSTILIFGIALGISIDDAIHYLAKYRQELKAGKSIREASLYAIREAGVGMIYTSMVLLCGFSVFTFSEFGGTKALGLLVSITLLVAMFCNLIILPSLLMSLDKWLTTKAFREPFLEIYDEEVDEELSEIQVIKQTPPPTLQ